MNYAHKWPEYAKQWDVMAIKPARVTEFRAAAQFALDHRDHYRAVEAATGVPWPMVACIHRRESDPDKNGNPSFDTYLGNGQPLSKRTTIVPKERGPFTGPHAFVDGGVDAFKLNLLSSQKDWRLEKELYFMEVLNGGGYAARGLPSPYIWGGTNVQKLGKFVADHKFDARKLDEQPGCAPMLWMIIQLDPTVQVVRETP